MSFYKSLAILLGIAATLLAILAAAVYYGYIPTSLVDNLTDTELGTFAALAVGGAIGAEAASKSRER